MNEKFVAEENIWFKKKILFFSVEGKKLNDRSAQDGQAGPSGWRERERVALAWAWGQNSLSVRSQSDLMIEQGEKKGQLGVFHPKHFFPLIFQVNSIKSPRWDLWRFYSN